MQRHIIKRQILDLQVPSQQGSFELQNRVSALYRNKIIPLIDTLFSQFSDPDEIHRIDSLEIDLGIVNINDLEILFVAKVEEQLHRQLAAAIKSKGDDQVQLKSSVKTNEPQTSQQTATKQTRRSRAFSDHSRQPDQTLAQLDLFNHFIQTGTLPWWAEPLSPVKLAKLLDDLIINQPEQIKPVLLHTLQDQQQLRRLIEQFSDANLLSMVRLLAPGVHNFIADFNGDLLTILKATNLAGSLSDNRLRLEQWRGILFSLTSGTATVPDKHQLIRQTVLHIATSFGTPYHKLIEQIEITVAQLQQSGQHFDSDLPDIIEQIDKAESSQQRDLPQTNTEQPTDKQSDTQSLEPLDNKLQQLEREESHQNKERFNDSETLDNKLQQLEQDELQRSKQRFNDSDELYLANAGLIILWPFLARLFETLGLVQAQQFKDIESVERAVHLLQYLVDESSETPEHLLPLNKLLCGLDLMEPVSASIDIGEQEKAECEKLLTAVIQHWTALKTTSVDGLRRAFLQREAILRIRDGGWLLQVERSTHDILLDNIPWSIRLVKLPWMEDMVYVEW